MEGNAADDGEGERQGVESGLQAGPQFAKDVRQAVTAEQRGLEEEHAAIPDRGAAAKQREDELGGDRLDQEEQRCAEEDGDGEEREHGGKGYQVGAVLRWGPGALRRRHGAAI